MTNQFAGTIRKALPADLNLLIDLGKSCFYEAFNEVTEPHDMAVYLNSAFQKSNIEKQLNDGRSLIFIAEKDPVFGFYCAQRLALIFITKYNTIGTISKIPSSIDGTDPY